MSINVLGKQFINGERLASGKSILKSINIETDSEHPYDFYEATLEEIDLAVKSAAEAYTTYRRTSIEERASFLEIISEEIDSLGSDFILHVSRETGLPNVRLEGEKKRTTNQLRLFAELLRRGDFLGARIDTAIPDREPLPKLDMRQLKFGLGPVGIFGASNFPLAFSVAGGDTASALAAGCPVVVKAHSSHLITSELIASAIERAVDRAGMPKGTFNLIYGDLVGKDLVLHPDLKAVGFTGSLSGGRALFDLATSRPEPIPVFAEMSSVNPVLLLNDALEQDYQNIAINAAASITNSCGQLCTKPGLIIGFKSEVFDQFKKRLKQLIERQGAQVMLNKNIQALYEAKVNELKSLDDFSLLATGDKEENKATACLFEVKVGSILDKNSKVNEEVFGPLSIVVELEDKEQLHSFLRVMSGQLTFTLHASEKDLHRNQDIFNLIENKVGRVLLNGFPTGVEVCDSMVHGGPYPSTTDSRGTSVGTLAIERFLRPICYQNYPDSLLPDALKNSNPLNITRLVNGALTTEVVNPLT